MLNNYKGKGEVVAEVLMTRRARPSIAVLVVEGSTDVKFWNSRHDRNSSDIVDANGKPNALLAVDELRRQAVAGVLGIVDEDFDGLEGSTAVAPEVIVTEIHDLECILLRSSALDRVIAECGEREKVNKFCEREQKSVRDAIIERGLPFGRMRWLNRRKSWGLCFDKLGPRRFIDSMTWVLNQASLEAEVAKAAAIPVQALQTELAQLPPASVWDVCQGHDLVDILAIGVENVLGSHKCGRQKVGEFLRIGYDIGEFKSSKLHADVATWQTRNVPWRVLPSP